MIFVTGGNGFLGSHLLAALAVQETEICALKRESSSLALCEKIFRLYGAEAHFSKIRWVIGDVTDSFSVEESMAGAAEVYHCASVVSFLKKDKWEMNRINGRGTANVVNAALHTGVKKFCHVSSIATLGRNSATGLFDEETLWEDAPDNSNYSRSKWQGELEVWRGMAEGLNAVIVNPAVILGPGDWNRGSTALFQLARKGMPYYTEGVNGYVDVKDVVSAMLKLMKSEVTGERFVLSSEDLSYLELFSLMADAFGKKRPSRRLTPFTASCAQRAEAILAWLSLRSPRISRENVITAFHVYRYSSEKIRKQLNFTFRPVEESVKETAALLLQGF